MPAPVDLFETNGVRLDPIAPRLSRPRAPAIIEPLGAAAGLGGLEELTSLDELADRIAACIPGHAAVPVVSRQAVGAHSNYADTLPIINFYRADESGKGVTFACAAFVEGLCDLDALNAAIDRACASRTQGKPN